MRRSPVLSALAATLAVPALVALNAGTALAATATAPSCSSSSSKFVCDAFASVTTVTWTQSIRFDGITSTSTFNGPTILHSGCEVRANYTFSYSYVSGGVTFTSPTSSFLCVSTPPE